MLSYRGCDGVGRTTFRDVVQARLNDASSSACEFTQLQLSLTLQLATHTSVRSRAVSSDRRSYTPIGPIGLPLSVVRVSTGPKPVSRPHHPWASRINGVHTSQQWMLLGTYCSSPASVGATLEPLPFFLRLLKKMNAKKVELKMRQAWASPSSAHRSPDRNARELGRSPDVSGPSIPAWPLIPSEVRIGRSASLAHAVSRPVDADLSMARQKNGTHGLCTQPCPGEQRRRPWSSPAADSQTPSSPCLDFITTDDKYILQNGFPGPPVASCAQQLELHREAEGSRPHLLARAPQPRPAAQLQGKITPTPTPFDSRLEAACIESDIRRRFATSLDWAVCMHIEVTDQLFSACTSTRLSRSIIHRRCIAIASTSRRID